MLYTNALADDAMRGLPLTAIDVEIDFVAARVSAPDGGWTVIALAAAAEKFSRVAAPLDFYLGDPADGAWIGTTEG